MAGAVSAALRRIDVLIHGRNDRAHSNAVGRIAEAVSAAGASDACNESRAAEFAENLLKVGHGDLLSLGNLREGNRRGGFVQREIDHRGDGKASFRR